MGWRQINSNHYYQRSYRDADGRVRSRYLGRGPLAEMAASSVARRRDHRIETKEQVQLENEQIATLEKLVLEYFQSVDRLLDASMRLDGWHKHRGQWRRNGRITRRSIMSQGFKDMDRLIEAEKIRRGLSELDFDQLMLWYRGDLAQEAVAALASRITEDPRRKETLQLKVDQLRRQLAGDNPSPIQNLLAERVAVCWLDAYCSDMLAQTHRDRGAGDLAQRRQDRAQRRYLAAVKALAECRKIEASTIRDAAAPFKVVG